MVSDPAMWLTLPRVGMALVWGVLEGLGRGIVT